MSAAKSLVPTGILSIVLLVSHGQRRHDPTYSFPISKTRNATKSTDLEVSAAWKGINQTYVKTNTTVNKYQVCLAGKRYKKHLRR
jgi:hypothetical protein